MTRSRRQLMRCGRESGHSSGGRQPHIRPKPSGLLDGKRVLVKSVGRKTKMGLETEVIEGGEGRNIGTCAPYARREGFTPLTRTPKEILAMDNVNFPPPPSMVGTPKKQNMNKFCDYHQDRGHNTNDCYHLKKQIEEAVASGRLAHLVKDIRQGGQKGKGSAKGKEKVINMEEKLPEDPINARTLMEKIRNYTMEGGVLYRKSYLVPLMRCVGPLQANYVIREVHMGSCGMHDGPRQVVAKVMNLGYYWPSMHRDARELIRAGDDCQAHASVPRLPKGPERVKYLIVAIAYFTKWMEAKPLATITGKQVVNFAYDNIVCRFGIPATIITDNKTQFVNDPFKKWAEKLKIQLISTSVYHPQGNGAVERANKSLLRGIKTRLEKGGSAWAEEVPNVLWAHRTMKKTSNGETPFSLTYGTEAVIPAEIGMPTHRTSSVNEKTNDQELRLNLNLLEERREIAAIREARYKQQVEKYYNKKVRHVQFKVGEFVLRRNEVSRAANTGKLGPTWEGPYKVIQAFQSGAYKLSNMEGEEIPRTWHACNLRRCYM
ncbi:reverse transcriptase domain-containing protein [Tanacetum coccineum]